MSECGAASIYCRDEGQWTFHCVADEGHEPGQHDYQFDAGQQPIPDPNPEA